MIIFYINLLTKHTLNTFKLQKLMIYFYLKKLIKHIINVFQKINYFYYSNIFK